MKKGNFWIILGFLFLAAACGFAMKNWNEDADAGKASREVYAELTQMIPSGQAAQTAEQGSEEEQTQPENSDLPEFVLYPDMEMPSQTIGYNTYIGTLDIPSLGMQLPVMQEWSYERLRVAPCRYSGSVYTNDFVICGHNYRTHFYPLKSLPEGAQVIFTDMAGNVFYYELAYMDVLSPNAVEDMIQDDGSWDMTLFTCTNDSQFRSAMRFTMTGYDAA